MNISLQATNESIAYNTIENYINTRNKQDKMEWSSKLKGLFSEIKQLFPKGSKKEKIKQ